MEYQALYRRWRPRGFTDFVGQQHVVTTLSNAIENKRIAHAYLFTGPRGTGKTSTAKIFAKALNCVEPNGIEPCDRCSSCQRINEGIYLDVLEIDGASNRGIDEIRDLREKIKFAPSEGKYKIYIIDEVHMLTMEAFNALLKTLEEPPKFVVFILATTEVHKLPLTILSRCQRFDFKRFTINEIKSRLETILAADELNAEEEALELIAKHAEGGMRDALSLLEQCISHSQGGLKETDVRAILGLIGHEEIHKITQALKNNNPQIALQVLASVAQDGKDLFQFGRSLVDYYRDLLLAVLSGNGETLFTPEQLIGIIETIAQATNEVKKSFQNALPLELAFIKLTTNRLDYQDLSVRLTTVEEELHRLKQSGQSKGTAIPVKEVSQSQTPAVPFSSKSTEAGIPVVKSVNPVQKATHFNWDIFLEAVKNRKRTVAALVQEGKPVSFDDGTLVIGFPAHLKFHLESLALPHNQELLESILKEMFGEKVKVSCVPQNDNPQVTIKPQHPEKKPDVLQQAVSLFGGKIEPKKEEEETP